MIVKIYTTAALVGTNTAKRCAGGILLLLTTDYGDLVNRRLMSFPFGKITLNRGVVMAARIGLMSIVPKILIDASLVQLVSNNPYVADMTKNDNGRFINTPVNNVDAVLALRDWYGRAGNISVTIEKYSSGFGAECLSLARKTANDQVSFDSNTEGPDSVNNQTTVI